jgi:uncharacterized membrane protein YqiK
MGWLTWVIIAVVVLVILGIGVQAFLSGLWTGAQKVGSNSIVQNLTGGAKDFAKESVRNATNNIIP